MRAVEQVFCAYQSVGRGQQQLGPQGQSLGVVCLSLSDELGSQAGQTNSRQNMVGWRCRPRVIPKCGGGRVLVGRNLQYSTSILPPHVGLCHLFAVGRVLCQGGHWAVCLGAGLAR